jgi:S1-C subfamily serine protease/predicted esterase
MIWRHTFPLLTAVACLGLAAPPARAADDDDLNALLEKAFKAAVKRVAPSVVQINTIGGTDRVVVGARGTQIRKAIGPTTGVIIDPDGLVISSAFNFINKPKTILVAVPGTKKPYPAKIVATDTARMLTLLKINAKGLPVPPLTPKKEIKVGQWALALGRTLDPNTAHLPSISVGIVSALDRIWGRAVQTDAKVSPVNYGGPSVDVQGRIQGILVPASPEGDDGTAGVGWYDSGIGFAIPMDDIKRVLPRLKKGENLRKGVLGVRLNTADQFGSPPGIAMVMPNTAAARVGLKAGDVIVEVDGKPVQRLAQLRHLLGPKYEGDTIALKVKRAGKTVTFPSLKLVGQVAAFDHSFLGIVPMRDDPQLGVLIRYVYPKSPAERAGLKVGDRIMKVGVGRRMIALNGIKSGRDQLTDLLNPQRPGTKIRLSVKRKGATKTLTATLDSLSGTAVSLVPETLPEGDSLKKAHAPRWTLDRNGKPVKPKPVKKDPKAKAPETGLVKRLDASGSQTYYVYVHDDYDADISHGLVVWLAPAGKFTQDDVETFQETWEDFCRDNHLILVIPTTKNQRGFQPSDTTWIVSEVKTVMRQYTVDPARVVAHGMGVGGTMAFHLGFHAREVFRGVATMGSVLSREPADSQVNQRLCFFVATGDKDLLRKAITQGKNKLAAHKYPVVFRSVKGVGAQYYDLATLKEVIRWIDSLDRL